MNGRKRHILVDTLGLLLAVVVTAASVQDRDGATDLLGCLGHKLWRLRLIWADQAYAGDLIRGMWRDGLGPSAEDVVAALGYDRLDWRPVLRQIRAQLIGEMSGYGGPNITTRAGSRKA